MEKPANKLIVGTQETHDEVMNCSLKLLRDKIENLDHNAEFKKNQTLIINEIIHKAELKDKELPKGQDFTEKRAKKRKNLANILNGLKNQQQVKEHKKNNEILIRINGFYQCPECDYKTKWNRTDLGNHLIAVHRKLKLWNCSDCTKAFAKKQQLSQHRLSVHNTNKNWICDCCGSRFGYKYVLRLHMMTHLPPSFSCLECGKKFVHVFNLYAHKKLHQGILNEICKVCNKGYTTKVGLTNHIISKHFDKFHCEVTGCFSFFSSKKSYKAHLKTIHKKNDQAMIGNLIKSLEKLKPNFQQLKYV